MQKRMEKYQTRAEDEGINQKKESRLERFVAVKIWFHKFPSNLTSKGSNEVSAEWEINQSIEKLID